jgi:hypothetical protein
MNHFYNLPIHIQDYIITLKFKHIFNDCIKETISIAKFIKKNIKNYEFIDKAFNNKTLEQGFLLGSCWYKNETYISSKLNSHSNIPTKKELKAYLRNNGIKGLRKFNTYQLEKLVLSF